jgi:hypothetical protein
VPQGLLALPPQGWLRLIEIVKSQCPSTLTDITPLKRVRLQKIVPALPSPLSAVSLVSASARAGTGSRAGKVWV